MNGQGHMVLGCSVAGVNQFAEIAITGRYASDPLGALQTPTIVQTSSSAYNVADGVNPHRWGDYSLTTVDPNDDMTFWTAQEYCNTVSSWGVRIIQLKAPPPAIPSICNPAIITAPATNVDVVVTGLSSNASGFFDPGTGFSNHISAVVNGAGVTVTGVTYTDPTHVTLRLTIAGGAVSGTRSLTVTNPDGQTATSLSGILTINLLSSNHPPTLSQIPDLTVNEGSTLLITNVAADVDSPPGTLRFTLLAPPAGAAIGSATGVFAWTPSEAQGPATNNIAVVVTDNGSP